MIIETKYEIGQTVWYIDAGTLKAVQGNIKSIGLSTSGPYSKVPYYHFDNHTYLREDQVSLTKEGLIETL